MKMSLSAKSLSIDLLAILLSLIPFLQIKALAPDMTTSLSLVNTINVVGNETDFHALLAIKSNISPEYQQALSSWNESLHFCHWEGVKCGRRHERVTVIDLTSRGLTGSLSPSIGNLSFLRELNLYNNTFRDNWLHPIPKANEGQREFVGLNLLQIIDIAIDVACALDYLHHRCGRPIIHCDLKPSNILLDGDMVAHVGDFGLARFYEEHNTPSTSSSIPIRGTIGYAAPEYGLGSEPSTIGDVYSYGILLLEMITSKRPTDKIFEADHNLQNFAKVTIPQGVMEIVDPGLLTEETYGSKMVECLIAIIKIGLACSTESPKDRMSINTVLQELHLVKNNILKGDKDS